MWVVPSQLRDSVPGWACSTSESPSHSNGSGSDISLHCTVSGTPTLQHASSRVWKTRAWSRALFGAVISDSSTASRFVEQWTSRLRACHVRHTALPANNSDMQTTEATETEAGRSRSSSESFPKCDPPWCSLKMSQLGLPLDGFDFSERNYADWVTRSRIRSLSLRSRLEQAIGAKEYSSLRWTTPQTSECESAPRPSRKETGRTTEYLGRQVAMWPSPRAEDSESCGNHPDATDSLTGATRLWPTPVANDDNKSPEAHMRMKANMPGGPRTQPTSLQVVSQMWQTPQVPNGGGKTRGQDRSDELLLEGQASMWATPTAAGSKGGSPQDSKGKRDLRLDLEKWPTPQARDFRSGQASQETMDSNARPLNEVAESSHLVPVISTDGVELSKTAASTTSRRRLNPAFGCWLQGWPWWWTRAEQISFAASEMVVFHCALQSRLSTFFSDCRR